VRLAFLGTPEAAVPSLRALVEGGHEVSVVVTRPDRRRGRGGELSHSPVHRAAADLGLDVAHSLEALESSGAERAVVVAYGSLIPAGLLERVPMLNVHFSLLPRWRGAAPVERAILAGDVVTGVSIMTLEATLDTGPIHLAREVPIGHKGAAELIAELAVLGAAALLEVLANPQRLAHPTVQSGEVTYAAKLSPEDHHLTPEMGVERFLRVVRLGRAFTVFAGRRLKVRAARALDAEGAAGTVLVGSGTVALALVDGAVSLESVVPEGGAPMSADAWWRGARIDPETVRWG
jgi:methionyl-tRNA formyltransferase